MSRLDLFEKVADQLVEIDTWRQRKQRVSRRVEEFTPQSARLATEHAKWWPGVEFGVIEALSKEGIGPDSDEMKRIAFSSTMKAISEGRFGDFMLDRARGRRGVQGQSIPGFNVMSPQAQQEALAEQARGQELVGAAKPRIPGFHVMSPEAQAEALQPEVESIVSRAARGGTTRGLTDPQQEAAFEQARQLSQQGVSFEAGVEPTLSVGKGATRALTTVFEAPVQEFQGLIRNAYAAATGEDFDWNSQSDLGIIVSKIARGEPIDQGTGFFQNPESEVARERREREADRGQIGGHNITLGRIAADGLNLSPDTVPFDLVSGAVDVVPQILDPGALVGGKIVKASRARKIFSPAGDIPEAGLFKGMRKQFSGPTFDAYKKRPEWVGGFVPPQRLGGQGLQVTGIAEKIAAEPSARKIFEASSVGGKARIDPAIAKQLAEAPDVETVNQVIDGVIGTQIRATHELDLIGGRLSSEGFQKLNPRFSTGRLKRWVEPLPASRIDTSNPREAATTLDRWLVEAKVSDAVRDEVFDTVATAQGRNGIFQATAKAMSSGEGVLVQAGISKSNAREITRLFTQLDDTARGTFIDEIGSDIPTRENFLLVGDQNADEFFDQQSFEGMGLKPGEATARKLGDKAVQSLSPQLSLEHIDRYIPLPDVKRLKRAIRDPRYRWLTTDMEPGSIGKARWPRGSVSKFMEETWKPLQLLGRFPAWITRVLSEEQIRMAAAGLDTTLNHPISYMATTLGKRFKLTPAGEPITEVGVRGARHIADELEDFQMAVAKRGGGGLVNRPGASRFAPKLVAKGEAEYTRALGDQIGALYKAPETRQFLNTGTDDTIDYLFHGAGQQIRNDLLEAKPTIFATKGGTRRWLEETITDRVNVVTGGNTELLDAAKTGTFRGKSIFAKGSERTALDKDFVRALDDFEDVGPDAVKGFDEITKDQLTKKNQAVNWMFAQTMGRAGDRFSTVPALRQNLWNETSQLLPFATKEVQEAVLANARNAKLGGRMLRKVERATRKQGDKFQAVEELDELARGYAIDKTLDLLYDLTRKNKVSEAIKVAAPFANAWMEILGTWGKQFGLTDMSLGRTARVVQAGRRLRRGQQAIEGARGESSIAEKINMGMAPSFFFKDQFGEEVFVFPFSAQANSAITGVPVPMTGQVKGLNMIGDVVPGLGPVAAIPLQWMLQDMPEAQDFLDVVLPFGAPGQRDPADAFNIIDTIAPSWMRKMFLAASTEFGGGESVVTNQQGWMNTQKDVFIYGVTSGKIDSSTPEGIQEGLEWAKDKSRDLFYVRAWTQFGAPTSPSWQFMVEDKSGKLQSQAMLRDWFWGEIVDNDREFDDVSFEFIDRWGLDALGLTEPKTETQIIGGLPRTKEAGQWLKRNKGVRSKYPATYGLFAPQGGEFDYSVFVKGIVSGEGKTLTPKEYAHAQNATLAQLQIGYYRDQLGDSPTDEQRAWLRGIQDDVNNDFPHSTTGQLERVEAADAIAELRAASTDGALPSAARKPIQIYLQARDQAKAQADEAGMFFGEPAVGGNYSQALRPTREWLANGAKQIIEEYPAFEPFWTSVFSREIDRDLR